jgi:hypothetical protein
VQNTGFQFFRAQGEQFGYHTRKGIENWLKAEGEKRTFHNKSAQIQLSLMS